jgi:hypothetical protein
MCRFSYASGPACLRFIVAWRAVKNIGGKTYKVSEETTASQKFCALQAQQNKVFADTGSVVLRMHILKDVAAG